VDQYQAILPSLTPERLDDFVSSRLFSRLFLEALVVGNIPAGQAGHIVAAAQQKMREAWGTSDVWQG
jgi:secreted Zn-dependent insulinase-like peptidase